MEIGLWSEELKPGSFKLVPLADLQLRNVALGENLKDATERTVLKLTHLKPVASEDDDDDDDGDDEPATIKTTTVICALVAGKVEQYSCQISLFEDEEYTFEIVGKNTVYLTGNYISQGPASYQGSDIDEDEDEDEFDLRDVSSDVELDMAGLDPAEIESDGSRFEEVESQPPKTSKRQRDSDITNGDAAESKDDSKAQKKLKKEDGKSVTTKTEGEQKEQKAKKDKKKEKNDKKGNVREIVGGIKIKDAKIGTGPQAKKGDSVSMRYIGKYENGTIFDQNTKGPPFSFKLGKGEVIKGWDEGIVGMQVGGERSLTIPGPMAYGKKPPSGIPPNATLLFDVKLLGIRK